MRSVVNVNSWLKLSQIDQIRLFVNAFKTLAFFNLQFLCILSPKW